MPRGLTRVGPVDVVVIVPSAPLRAAVVGWLRAERRVQVVRAVAHAADLGDRRVECDLVVASALGGARELREIGRRFGSRAGLVALSLDGTVLPAPWSAAKPGASRAALLDHAMPHPERTFAKSAAALSAIVVAFVGVVLSVAYVPVSGVSFDRAALAYAARYPDAGTWWHVYGLGGPYLATAEWPLLKAVASLGGGPEAFVPLAGAVVALLGVAFLLLALRLGAGPLALPSALAAVALPAVWVWPRAGDAGSVLGLAGVLLALAGDRLGRARFLAAALATAVSAFGGVLWILVTALALFASGVLARRVRVSLAGALFGALATLAVTGPPLVARGAVGVAPPLARTPTLSDLAPLVAVCALTGAAVAARRARPVPVALAVAAVVGASALALAVPARTVGVAAVASTGAMGRLAVHPTEALEYATLQPDLPTTGSDAGPDLMLGALPKAATNARLEWLGADRAVLPDRSSAIVFNERDWSLLDRERLLFSAPSVRPVLTAGITPTLLVVADDPDAATFGDALVALGATSERVIAVRSRVALDELDRDTLREFTMLVVYGRPWRDVAKAGAVLDDYLALSGFVFMDAAGLAGAQPLVGEARTVPAGSGDTRTIGDAALLPARAFDGRVVGVGPFTYRSDPAWEQAALAVGNDRVVQYGESKVAGDVGVPAHMVWSGVDLPARATAGDAGAMAQLESALSWMLTAADVQVTGGYGRPSGDVLETDIARSRFVDPTHWRIELKAAATGILFKQRYHPQWRAYQVDRSPSGLEQRTPLKGLSETAMGEMYVTLPPNARIVDLVFERDPFEPAERGLSLLATAIVVGVSLVLWRRGSLGPPGGTRREVQR